MYTPFIFTSGYSQLYTPKVQNRFHKNVVMEIIRNSRPITINSFTIHKTRNLLLESKDNFRKFDAKIVMLVSQGVTTIILIAQKL